MQPKITKNKSQTDINPKNPKVYLGNYFEGKKHGIGTYHYNDGSMYIGNWKDNNITGYVYFVKTKFYFIRDYMNG